MTRRVLVLAALLAAASALSAVEGDEGVTALRRNVLAEDLRLNGIRDERVLEAMRKVKRHLFVAEELRDAAYGDHPLPIGHEQTISQPYVVAFMSQEARVSSGDRVLEIGTGSGYQAAVLAELGVEVYSVEIVKELAESAAARLAELGYANVHVRHGDGYAGWPEHAPFDAIVVTAAPDKIPERLVEQLKVGGRMVIPIGSFYQDIYLVTKTEKGVEKRKLLPVRFVPMVKGDKKP